MLVITYLVVAPFFDTAKTIVSIGRAVENTSSHSLLLMSKLLAFSLLSMFFPHSPLFLQFIPSYKAYLRFPFCFRTSLPLRIATVSLR
ncbi:hypothetical protein KSX_86860 [Ktedonospora formicarum]|uniref:Uncharacterized protein n=1 Tax=Ktedonospora formicarum TaxID=2778364 RepID=A0A8J3IDW5_9CHLR|nr:hypothetical protein KSX_86860 [Ktedonospora formicarum]